MNIIEKQSLESFNTFGIDVKASYFARVDSTLQLQQSIVRNQLIDPYLILGGGSNILFTQDFQGLVLKSNILYKGVAAESENDVVLSIGSGVNWHELVMWTLDKGWSGLENLSLIPGTVGASPVQNIGAYGVELQDVFVGLYAIHLQSGDLQYFDKSQCNFDYRWSIFKGDLKGQYFITEVLLRVKKQSKALHITYGAIQSQLEDKGISQPTAKDVSDIIIAIRQSKLPDPAEIGNAGSFFKNPIISTTDFAVLKKSYPLIPSYPISDSLVKVPAGWLIDRAGWKGRVVGNTGTYQNQALVLVNHGDATGAEIWNLAQAFQKDVYIKYAITLEAEVNVI